MKTETQKTTFNSLYQLQQYGTSNWESALITYKQQGIFEKYNKTERTYRIHNFNKYFNPTLLGSSLFGSCLDGTDDNVRIDLYFNNCPIETIIIEK